MVGEATFEGEFVFDLFGGGLLLFPSVAVTFLSSFYW